MTITVERDPRTREIQIRGPDGFTASLDDQVISSHGLLGVQKLLNEVYAAGLEAGKADGEAWGINLAQRMSSE